jgi:transcriptional regulator with XRE-family HTH domain
MTGPSVIKAARLDKGLTIREAAKQMGEGVTADILLRAENGATPRPAAAKKIADFCGCSVTDIWPVKAAA